MILASQESIREWTEKGVWGKKDAYRLFQGTRGKNAGCSMPR